MMDRPLESYIAGLPAPASTRDQTKHQERLRSWRSPLLPRPFPGPTSSSPSSQTQGGSPTVQRDGLLSQVLPDSFIIWKSSDDDKNGNGFQENLSLFRHSGLGDGRVGGAGEVNNFRHMLGLDTNPGTSNMKARTMKDSKEIMKKRRERAICIVSMR